MSTSTDPERTHDGFAPVHFTPPVPACFRCLGDPARKATCPRCQGTGFDPDPEGDLAGLIAPLPIPYDAAVDAEAQQFGAYLGTS